MDPSTAIFAYQYRGEQRFADPTEVLDTLHSFLGSVADAAGLARSENPYQARQYKAKMREAAAAAFGLAEFDPKTGQGATQAELLNLIFDFYDWKEKKKLSTGSSPTSAPSTDSEQSAPGLPPPGDNSPMTFSSVFG